jgi:hypothetical protein
MFVNMCPSNVVKSSANESEKLTNKARTKPPIFVIKIQVVLIFESTVAIGFRLVILFWPLRCRMAGGWSGSATSVGGQ